MPALQKHFVNIFFVFAWEFCIEKRRGFLVIFSGLRFSRNEARKLLEKFGENSEQNSGRNSGRKFKKFGELSFCNFSDLISCETAMFVLDCRERCCMNSFGFDGVTSELCFCYFFATLGLNPRVKFLLLFCYSEFFWFCRELG